MTGPLETNGFNLLTRYLPLALLLAIAWFRPQLGQRWWRAAEVTIGRVARHRLWALALVAGVAAGLSIGLSALVRPVPRGHDEFSYLLAGDTFAHARLTNPTHPLWVHFESPHIIQQPSYASKYPPAQGLTLALGEVVCGRPLAGVWLSMTLACVAITWMLYGWLSPRWALLGGLLSALHPSVLMWSQSFMGGTVAVAGGALVVGAMRRSNLPAFVLGAAILSASRPYEGAVLSLLAAVDMLVRTEHRVRLGAQLGAALLGIVSWQAYYNWRVTRDAWRMPYEVHEAAYSPSRTFVWQPERPMPVYRHAPIRDLQVGAELEAYRVQQTPGGFPRACWKKLIIAGEGFFPVFVMGFPMWVLLLPLAALPAVLRDRWMCMAGLLTVSVIIALMPVKYLNLYNAAPITGLVVLLIVQTLRHVRTWHRWGRALTRLTVAMCFVAVLPTGLMLAQSYRAGWWRDRERIASTLAADGRRHLVIVRYAAGHSPYDEWVYNAADIDASPVVWAREMNDNRALLDYFRDRQIWLLEPDAPTPRLVPYPVQR